jgi:hypothetical protein
VVEDLKRGPLRLAQGLTIRDGATVHRAALLIRPSPAFRLQLQSVIYLDVTVTYGLASSQRMELGHHRVVRKFFPDKIDEFP